MVELLGNSIGTFLLLTLVVFGPLAFATGQGVARNWQGWELTVLYCLMLAAVERFADFALADGELLAAGGFVVSAVVLAGIGLLAWRRTRVGMMIRQYPWLYEAAGPLAWRARGKG